MNERGLIRRNFDRRVTQPIGKYIDRLLEPSDKASVRRYFFTVAAVFTLMAGVDVALNIVFPSLNSFDGAAVAGPIAALAGVGSVKI
jgi:hypothetical protein